MSDEEKKPFTIGKLFDTWEELVLAMFGVMLVATCSVMLYGWLMLDKEPGALMGLFTLLGAYTLGALTVVIGGKKAVPILEKLIARKV